MTEDWVKEWSGNRSDSLIGQGQALLERYPFIRLCYNDRLCKGWSLGLCVCVWRISIEYIPNTVVSLIMAKGSKLYAHSKWRDTERNQGTNVVWNVSWRDAEKTGSRFILLLLKHSCRRPKKSRILLPFPWVNYPLNATGVTHNTFVCDYSKLQSKDKHAYCCWDAVCVYQASIWRRMHYEVLVQIWYDLGSII